MRINVYVFRFIDDLAALNDGEQFEKALQEIYPPYFATILRNARSDTEFNKFKSS